MSQLSTLNSFDAPRALSAGNMVSVAVQLYLRHFKTYSRIAFFAALWVLVPVYGWAKFCGSMAHICRMAGFELMGRTDESEEEARRITDEHKWELLRVVVLQVLAYTGLLLLSILVALLVALLGVVTLSRSITPQVASLVGVVVGGFGSMVILSFLSRWLVAESSIAIELAPGARTSLCRSWNLSEGSFWRIQLLLLVALLVTLPFLALDKAINQLFPVNSQAFGQGDYSSLLISWLVSAAFFVLNTTLTGPFWQTLRATLYIDLRRRREGLGLQLTRLDADQS